MPPRLPGTALEIEALGVYDTRETGTIRELKK
jgi:hypothetical protein